MLSQFTKEVPSHVTLADLDYKFGRDVYPVGRLDHDSEGLLILTNDKTLNAKLLSPKEKQPKQYWAQVERQPKDDDLAILKEGVTISVRGKKYKCAPAIAKVINHNVDVPERVPPIRVRKNIPTTWVKITLTEGKNRQVRKMLAGVGFPVLRLIRVEIAGLVLGEGRLAQLKVGEAREVEL